MPIRTYSLNSREAYEALRRDPLDLWGPRRHDEPRIPPGGEDVGPFDAAELVVRNPNIDEVDPEGCVRRTERGDQGRHAREWLWHLENGGIGGDTTSDLC